MCNFSFPILCQRLYPSWKMCLFQVPNAWLRSCCKCQDSGAQSQVQKVEESTVSFLGWVMDQFSSSVTYNHIGYKGWPSKWVEGT